MNNPLEDFYSYIKGVFDTDKDGSVSIKETFLGVAGSAPLVIAIFVEILVMVAEFRVWDLGVNITGGNFVKALGFVLISAVPFYLGQLAWLYPRANGWQKFIGLAMVAGGLITSMIFGRVDLMIGIDILVMSEVDVVSASTTMLAVYVAAGLFYLWMDDGVTQMRVRIIAKYKAQAEAEKLKNMRIVLSEYRKTHALRREIEGEFGADTVEAYEKKPAKKQEPQRLPISAPMVTNAYETKGESIDPNAGGGGSK